MGHYVGNIIGPLVDPGGWRNSSEAPTDCAHNFFSSMSIPPVMTDQLRLKIIDENPIGKGLDAFRASFNSICQGAHICTPHALEQLGHDGKAETTTSS